MNNTPTPPVVNLNIEQTEPLICECGNHTFVPVVFLRKVSEIISPTGKKDIARIAVMACNACGAVPPEFIPPYMLPKEPTALVDSTDVPTPKSKLTLLQ